MKRDLFFGICLFCYQFTFAQIEMNSNGDIRLGNQSFHSGYKLSAGNVWIYDTQIDGTAYFPGNQNTGIMIESYGYSYRRLRPYTNNTATVGAPTYGFNNIYYYNLTNLSDSRQKENVRSLKGSLDIIKSLNGVMYDWKMETYGNRESARAEEIKIMERDRKDQIGFIAQDVNKVLPQVVNYDDSTDVYGINYTQIIPLLVEGMKEQQAIIESLQKEITTLKTQKSAISDIAGDSKSEMALSLEQNFPNPFDRETTISFSLPDQIKSASIFIYDLNGVQLRSIEITQRGSTDVKIQAGELKAGMYLYALVADGKVADTKRMILTK